MNAHAPVTADPADPPADVDAGALVAIEAATALSVLTDPEQFDAFYAKVKAQTDAFVPDLTTLKGRKAVASLARKVANTKVAIVAAANDLTEEWRANTAKVVASRKAIQEKLDTLRDEVRKPLTDWEAAEAEREATCKATLDRLNAVIIVSIEDTPETVQARLDEVQAIEITDEVFQEYAAAARATQRTTIETLTVAVARLTREAEERAELERLRAEKAEREARESEERARAEQEAREAAEARLREEEAAAAAAEEERRRQEAAELAGRERAAAAERAAAEAEARVRAEAEAAAQAEREAQEREHQAQLEREREAREEADRARAAAEAEAKRLADAEAARLAQEAAEERRREVARQDRELRGQVMAAVKTAIMEVAGVKEEAAKKIVLAIVADEIPHVSISFDKAA